MLCGKFYTKQSLGLSQFTAREKETLCKIARGRSNKEVTEKFFISEHSIKSGKASSSTSILAQC